MTRRIACAIVALFAFLAGIAPIAAVEDIRSYDTAITVLVNGAVDVTESITINAEGVRFLHGVFRDVGRTHLVQANGKTVNAKLKIVSVLRNGEPVPFRVEDYGAKVRVYMGDADMLLPPGIHLYALRYLMSDSVVTSGDANTIAWDVIDAGWPFQIRKATVSATLPRGATITQLDATIGTTTGEDAGTWTKASATSAHFVARRTVGDTEGLVINVTFEGGLEATDERDNKR